MKTRKHVGLTQNSLEITLENGMKFPFCAGDLSSCHIWQLGSGCNGILRTCVLGRLNPDNIPHTKRETPPPTKMAE